MASDSSTTSEQIDLVFYGNGALDVVYVDPTSRASIKIASGEWAQSCTTTSGVE